MRPLRSQSFGISFYICYFKSDFANYRSVSTIVKENLLILIRKLIQATQSAFLPTGFSTFDAENTSLALRNFACCIAHVVEEFMAASTFDLQAIGSAQKKSQTEPENTRKRATIMVQ